MTLLDFEFFYSNILLKTVNLICTWFCTLQQVLFKNNNIFVQKLSSNLSIKSFLLSSVVRMSVDMNIYHLDLIKHK